jgi:hypothetical protein
MKVTGSGPMVNNRKSGQGSSWTVVPAEEGEGERGGGDSNSMTKKANQHLLDKNVMSSPISPPPTNLY